MKIEERLTTGQKRFFGLAVFLLFAVFCLIFGIFVGGPMIRFVSQPERFRGWVDSHGIWGALAFVGMTAFQVLIALVPGEPLEIGAGYAFGTVEGTLLCIVGISLGSLLVFLLIKKFGIRFAEIFFSLEKINNLKILRDKKKRDVLIFLVFFLPGTPKDLLTYFAPLTDIKFGHFILLASVARLPSVITSTVGGDALGGKNYLSAVIVFSVTLIISAIGWWIYNIIINHKNK